MKLLASFWIYTLCFRVFKGCAGLGQSGAFRIFHGWDSIYYVEIASSGYGNDGLYTFLPGFPALIRGVNFVVHDPWEASALLSIVLGLAWVPVFQKLAEQYLPKRAAFESTVFAAAFPYVFLFTTVAYTEGLFVLATLSAWYFHLKQKHAAAGLAAAVAAITRLPGVLILLPMLLNFRKIGERSIVNFEFHNSYFFPVACVVVWVSYVHLVTGSWLTIVTSELAWYGRDNFGFWLLSPLLGGPHVYPTLFAPNDLAANITLPIIGFMALAAFFVSRTWAIDRRLGVYSWVVFLSVCFTTYFFSLLRYVAFIFPIWFMMRPRSSIGFVIMTPFFLLVSVFIWFMFLNGFIVG